MKSLAAGTLTALAQPSVPIVQLVHMAFSSPVALNTSTMDLVYGGVTYKGAYGLGSIGAVKDSPGEIKGLQFTLSGVSAASISLALDGGDVWQGCVVTIRTAILDANYAVTEAPIEWTGRGDVLSISEGSAYTTENASCPSPFQLSNDCTAGSGLTVSEGPVIPPHPVTRPLVPRPARRAERVSESTPKRRF